MVTHAEPVKCSRDDMRESIIHAARQVFSRFGFRKTSMDDIARAIRKGKSSIYYYFRSKEDIFQAVVDHEADHLRDKVNEILQSSMDAREKLRAHVKLRMDLIRQMINYTEVLKNEDLDHLQFTESFRKKYDDEECRIISSIIEEGIAAGTFKVKDIELSALAIVTAMKGMELPLMASGRDTASLDALIDDLLDILFYGLVKR